MEFGLDQLPFKLKNYPLSFKYIDIDLIKFKIHIGLKVGTVKVEFGPMNWIRKLKVVV